MSGAVVAGVAVVFVVVVVVVASDEPSSLVLVSITGTRRASGCPPVYSRKSSSLASATPPTSVL